ncbi:MAG: MATE family efflux transporter [Saccharofermentans sp.]|nr:MATE family efflux transporter [Saccharofermentans sp.]
MPDLKNKATYSSVLRALLLLSIPTVIEEIMSILLQYVDTAMVGRLGEQATAAVSTTTTINWLIGCVPHALGVAIMALTARANGSGDEKTTKKLTAQALRLTIIYGLILTAICEVLSPYIPVWMHAAPEIRSEATMYFSIISLSLLFRTSAIVFATSIRAVKDTKTPMVINLMTNVLNAGLNYLLIYKVGLGVKGAAIATLISYTLSGIAMYIAVRSKVALRWDKEDTKADRELQDKIYKIAIPAFGGSAASCLGYVVFASMVSSLGTTVFAAHSIAVEAETLFYIPGYGFRTATSSLIGNALGEKDKNKVDITQKISIIITVSAMFISGIFLFVIARPLMGIFTESEAVISLGAMALKLVAFSEPFFGLMVVMEGIFYGEGKTREVFIVETLSMWGIRILSTFICVAVLKLGLREVWYCMIADNIFKAVMLYNVFVWQRRKARSKN